MARYTSLVSGRGAVLVVALFLSLTVILTHGLPLGETNLLPNPVQSALPHGDSLIDTDSLNVRMKRGGLLGLPVPGLPAGTDALGSLPLGAVPVARANSKAKSNSVQNTVNDKLKSNSLAVQNMAKDVAVPDINAMGGNTKSSAVKTAADAKSIADSDTQTGGIPLNVAPKIPAAPLPGTPDLPETPELPSIPKTSDVSKTVDGVKPPTVPELPTDVAPPNPDQVIKANAVDLKPSPGGEPPRAGDLFSAIFSDDEESEAEPAAEGAVEDEEADEETEDDPSEEEEEPEPEEEDEEEEPEAEEDEEEEPEEDEEEEEDK